MKIVAVIPARYESSRFPGKPLADICGKPMIWWVYQQVKKVKEFADVVVATDDNRIYDECERLGIKYVTTKPTHPNHIYRIHEVSEKIVSDLYVCVNGDEPLISPSTIRQALPRDSKSGFVFSGAMREMSDPAEVMDPANIKIVITKGGNCLYLSRTPVPFPKGTLLFKYHKYVGIECFSKDGLNLYVSLPKGDLEVIEDIDHLRFIENGYKITFNTVESDSISVDTPKDLDKVRLMMAERIKRGNER